MNITPRDIRNTSISGYGHVSYDDKGSAVRPYRANNGAKSTGTPTWYGPRRATALEAAQDYCDYINTGGVAAPATLRNAGHKGRRKSVPHDAEEAAALGVLRDKRAQRQHKIGFVYCITDGTAVKIGYSLKPEARVAELQTGNPRRLRLLASMIGTELTEKALHVKYLRHNVLQEWFRPTTALLSEFGLTKEALSA